MGLIKAGVGALGGVLADQWKEFFYCDALDMNTLMVKGEKRISKRSSNHSTCDYTNRFYIFNSCNNNWIIGFW